MRGQQQTESAGPHTTDPAARASERASDSKSQQPKSRLKSSDYRGWDKYDVDAELQKLEVAEAGPRDTDEQDALAQDSEPAQMTDLELRQHMALCEKENVCAVLIQPPGNSGVFVLATCDGVMFATCTLF